VGAPPAPARITQPLVASDNPAYFKDASGSPIVLAGSQTWNTFQDFGTDASPQALDFDAFVKFLVAHGHNFTLLWRIEMPKHCGYPSTPGVPPDVWSTPQPWLRTGPGKATDGGLKFDLNRFDQAYFDRLRTRVQKLREAGIYAGVYLFTGEYLGMRRCADDGYAFTGANNINGVDDHYSSGGRGTGSISMTAPNAITAFQDAYVEKLVDTLNDQPNVLWIVSEESSQDSVWWNKHHIAHLRTYEAGKPHQHPIGLGTIDDQPDQSLYDSDADWVAPLGRISPVRSCGSGTPRCKVNINDSDHSYWELWLQTPQQHRNFVWENFLNGNQVLFMDPYVLYYPRQNRNLCPSPRNGICNAPSPRYDNLRDNLGFIIRYSRRVSLSRVTPQKSLCSTGYCLAQTPAGGAEYLVYAPGGGPFTVNLSAMPGSRRLSVEWLNPASGEVTTQQAVAAGSTAQTFTPPFSGDAVLYLVDTEGHAASKH
jgi:hypothetical protein